LLSEKYYDAQFSAANRIFGTTAGGFSIVDISAQNPGCTSDAGPYLDRFLRTVHFTCSTFHAIVTADNPGFVVSDLKYIMRAYLNTHPATITTVRVKLQCHDIFQIQ
jgi:hypothetical protein